MDITFRTTGMPLEEFVALFDEEDPWSVSPQEWDSRVNTTGLPRGHYALTDLQMRDYMRCSNGEHAEAIRRLDEKSRLARQAQAEATGRLGSCDASHRKRLAVPAEGSLSIRVGSAIRPLRMQKGIGSRGLARATRISPTVLWRIENGLRAITLDELDRIALRLDTTPQALIERGLAEPGR